MKEIQDRYNYEVAHGLETREWEVYLREEYQHAYDIEGNFLGWEKI